MAISKEDRAGAEAQFHKTLKRAQEGKKSISQYEVDARVTGEKTAKLKALRLAKDAAEAKAGAEKKTGSRKSKPVAK